MAVEVQVARAQSFTETTRWVYRPVNDKPIKIRKHPDWSHQVDPDAGMISLEESFDVAEVLCGSDGIRYLRLADGRGWLFDKKPTVGRMCVRVEPPEDEPVATSNTGAPFSNRRFPTTRLPPYNSPASRAQPQTSSSTSWPIDREAQRFVADMRSQGHRNWVLYKGQVVNLQDPDDTADIPEHEFAKLLQQNEQPLLRHGKAVPLQPWEVEKYNSLGAQVVTLLNERRYTQDHGEMLLKELGGWLGAEDWAKEEFQMMHAVVQADDDGSRAGLHRWVEESVQVHLRELRKAVNAAAMAGLDIDGGAAGSGGAASSSASAAPASRLCRTEQEELARAIAESLEEEEERQRQEQEEEEVEEEEEEEEEEVTPRGADKQPASAVGGAPEQPDEGWEVVATPQPAVNDASAEPRGEPLEQEAAKVEEPQKSTAQEETQEKQCAAEEPVAEQKAEEPAVEETQEVLQPARADGPEPVRPAQAKGCPHTCDVNASASCCHCIMRTTRPGLVPYLVGSGYWTSHGVPLSAALNGPFRFLCGSCHQRCPGCSGTGGTPVANRRLPLPFGGSLLLPDTAAGDGEHEEVSTNEGRHEVVDPVAELASSEASWSEAVLSDRGSWVRVAEDDRRSVAAASDGSWVIKSR